MQISREQAKYLIQNRPEGTREEDVIRGLVGRGYEIEGLALPSKQPQKAEPNTFQRVSSTIDQAGASINQAISGEGEFAGQTPLERGTGAAAAGAQAIPNTALQAIPGAPGRFIRGGVEKIGNAFNAAIEPAVNYLSNTDLIKGAAGRYEYQPNGGVEYVPNDLGALEVAMRTAQNVGETAEVAAGAGVGPQAAANFAGRTARASKNVALEYLDRTMETTSTLSRKATPKTVRTLLRINDPETRSQAIDQLEDTYRSTLVEDRKAVNNRLDKLAAAESFGGNRMSRDALIREIAEEGYIPTIEGQFAKFDEVFEDINKRQTQLMEELDNELAPLRGIENLTSLDRIKFEAESVLRGSPQVSAGLEKSLRELARIFSSFEQKYGSSVDPVQINDIRKEMNRVTSAFKQEGGEALFQLDTAEAIGRTVRQRIDELVPSGRVRALNSEYARLERVDSTARILNNETIEVGLIGRKLGSYVGTIGASLAGLSIAGPGGLVVASIFAQLGSDYLAKMLRKRAFNPELQNTIVNGLKENPDLAERVIREASPEDKKFLRNLIAAGAAVGAAEFFVDEGGGVAAAALVGSTGGATPITARALDRVEEYIDHMEGVSKKSGQELIDLKADAQLIAERAGIDATRGDKDLANKLRDALDKQNFARE